MIPNHKEKYGAEVLLSPRTVVAEQGSGLPAVPPAVILGYQDKLTSVVERRADPPVDIVRSQYLYPLTEAVGYVPVHEWGIGAPVSATVTENVIAAGAEAVVLLGGGAGLQTDLSPDDAILPTDAIRDEGVSYHYIPGEDPVKPTPALVDSLAESLSDEGFDTRRGPTWTTSAFYRETLPEIERYRDEGVITLGMESAAIWAVCQYRGVDTATVHELGDVLTPEEWVPETDSDRGLQEMLDPTVEALERYVTEAK